MSKNIMTRSRKICIGDHTCCWLIDIADDDLESWLEDETDSRLEWGCCCGWGGRIPGSPEGWDMPLKQVFVQNIKHLEKIATPFTILELGAFGFPKQQRREFIAAI